MLSPVCEIVLKIFPDNKFLGGSHSPSFVERFSDGIDQVDALSLEIMEQPVSSFYFQPLRYRCLPAEG
jgi:hypothetical protein